MWMYTTYRYSSSLVCNVFSHAFQLPTGHKRNKSSLSLPPSPSLYSQLCIQLSCTAYTIIVSYVFLIYMYLSFWHTFVLYLCMSSISLSFCFNSSSSCSLARCISSCNRHTHSHHLQYYWVLTNTHTPHNTLHICTMMHASHTIPMVKRAATKANAKLTTYVPNVGYHCTNGKESCYQSQRYWEINSLHTYLMWGTTVYTNGKESCYQSQRYREINSLHTYLKRGLPKSALQTLSMQYHYYINRTTVYTPIDSKTELTALASASSVCCWASSSSFIWRKAVTWQSHVGHMSSMCLCTQ